MTPCLKRSLAAALALLLVSLSGCASASSHHLQQTLSDILQVRLAASDEGGVGPVALSDEGEALLRALGLEDDALILSLRMPEGAAGLSLNVYRLENGAWTLCDGGGLTWDGDAAQAEGTASLRVREDGGLALHLRVDGASASYSAQAAPEDAFTSSTQGFLQDFVPARAGDEIPVAFWVRDAGTAMRSYALDDFADPAAFDGMDFVQFATVAFEAP